MHVRRATPAAGRPRQTSSGGGKTMQLSSIRRTMVTLGVVATLAVGTGALSGMQNISTAQAAELAQQGGGHGGAGGGGNVQNLGGSRNSGVQNSGNNSSNHNGGGNN